MMAHDKGEGKTVTTPWRVVRLFSLSSFNARRPTKKYNMNDGDDDFEAQLMQYERGYVSQRLSERQQRKTFFDNSSRVPKLESNIPPEDDDSSSEEITVDDV